MPKPHSRAISVELQDGRLEQRARALEPQRLDVGGGGHADLPALNTRAKLRGLMKARSASAGTDRSASRLSAIQSCSPRTEGRCAAWPASPG